MVDNKQIKEAHNSENQPKDYYNLCCCETKVENHNINFIFQKDFDDNHNNHKIRFNYAEITNEKKYIPNYEKMILFVGKSKIIFDAIKFISSGEKNIFIYGDNIENLKKLGNAIIEYYNDISNLYKVDVKNNKQEIVFKSKNFVDINLYQNNSDDIHIENNLNNINDTIYFIYAYDDTSVDKIKIGNNKIF